MFKYNRKKLFLIILLLGISVSIFSSFADTIVQHNDWIYVLHLYYDKGQLFADRDYKFKYDLAAAPFAQETLTTAAPYRGVITNVQGKVDATFKFDPQKGNPSFTAGKISVKGPYFADAAKANFYDGKGKLLLTLDLSESSFCNDNGKCDTANGENYLNCRYDCPLPVALASPTPVAAPGLSSQPLFLISALVTLVVVVVLIVWFIIKRKKKMAGSEQIPPIPPISQ